MLYFVIAFFLAIFIFFIIDQKYNRKINHWLFSFVCVSLCCIVAFLLGLLTTHLYYTYGNPVTIDQEIDVICGYDISLDDFIEHEPLYTIDHEYNVHYIDFDNTIVEFQLTEDYDKLHEDKLYIRTYIPQSFVKLFLLEDMRTQYLIVFSVYDYSNK